MNQRLLAIEFILCFGIFSCGNKDFRTKSFILQDSTTLIEMAIPNEADSFYTWIDYDDIHCGHERKYRFSDSSYPVFQESGFFTKTFPDSVYRLTFSHTANLDCNESLWIPDLDQMKKGLQVKAAMDSIELVVYYSERKTIGDIDFYTIAFTSDFKDGQAYSTTILRSFFNVNNLSMKVEFECARKHCDKFLERMNKSLESIRVSKLK